MLLISLAAGALISILASLPGLARGKLVVRSHRRRVTELKTSLSIHKTQPEQAQEKLQGGDIEKSKVKVEERSG